MSGGLLIAQAQRPKLENATNKIRTKRERRSRRIDALRRREGESGFDRVASGKTDDALKLRCDKLRCSVA